MGQSPLSLAVPCVIALLAAGPAGAQDPAALIEDGHLKQARAAIEARASAAPNDPRTLYLEARLKLVTGDAKAALPLAEQAATLDAKNAEYRYEVAQCVGTMAQGASIFKAPGLAKRFKREAEATLALDPHNLDAFEGLIQFYSIAPGIVGGDDKKAAAMAEELVGIDAARGRLMQATLATNDKQEAKAEEALRQALAANPNNYRVRMTLARFYGSDKEKKWDVAEQHARAAIALEPGRIGGYATLAYLYAHTQRWDDLDRLLGEAERVVPDNLSCEYQAGRTLLADDREPARAEQAFRKYLTQEPEIGAPTLAHAHWRLGLVIEKQGRKSEAIAEIETALKLKPDLDDAKKDLKRLKRG
jgi:Tfp pilus assembly protein PilF